MKKIRELVERLKEWRLVRRRSRDYALFLRLFKDPKTDMEKIVGGQAIHMARAMTMNYLDNNRILHCRFCPNTAPLHIWGTGPAAYYVCEGHLKALEGGAQVKTVENPMNDRGKAAAQTGDPK